MKPVNLTIKHITDDHKTALVESKKGIFPVTVHPSVRFLIKPGYEGSVVKSAVTGEWILVDYITRRA